MPNNLPVILFPHLYHAGDLSKPAPTFANDTYEGSCLSVSLCPDDWIYIAKLKAKYIYTLKKDGNFQLLDIRAVQQNSNHIQAIIEWAQARQLIYEVTKWIGWDYDSEDANWSYGTYSTKEEADSEVEEQVEYRLEVGEPLAPEGHEVVEPKTMWVATPKLAKRMRQHTHGRYDALDFAVMAWAEDTVLTIDGVWWEDMYAPEKLSAPRGGLFQRTVEQCDALPVSADDWVCTDDDGN